MCHSDYHHLLAKLPGTPGKLLVHASYSLLGMCLEHVFQLDPFFLSRTLQLSYAKWCTGYLTRLLILCSRYTHCIAFSILPQPSALIRQLHTEELLSVGCLQPS